MKIGKFFNDGVMCLTFFVFFAMCAVLPFGFPRLALAEEANLIINPSFETVSGSDPLGWNRGGWGSNERALLYPVLGRDGGSAVETSIASHIDGDAKWYPDNIPVTPGTAYLYSDWYKSNNISSVVAEFTMNDGSFIYLDITGELPPTASWQQTTGNFVVPPEARSVTLMHLISSPATLTVDDVSLTINENLIPNPSLENADNFGDPDPISWYRGNWGTNNALFTYPVAGQIGAKAAEITITSYADGDAKWYFEPVAVVPGQRYLFTDNYKSDVQTTVVAQYTLNNGTYAYMSVGTPGPSANWTKFSAEIFPPENASAVTIFHLIDTVGMLAVDGYALALSAGPPPEPGSDPFSSGMVSLTFDDGWVSAYTNVLPILNAANMKGSFGIVSLETLDSLPKEKVLNPSLETSDASGANPTNWLRGKWGINNAVFAYPVSGMDGGKAARVSVSNHTSGDAKWYFKDVSVIDGSDYVIADYYESNAPTLVTARYYMGNNTYEYEYIATLPARTTWTKFSKQLNIPAGAESFTFFHYLQGNGNLAIDNVSVLRVEDYLSPEQVLDIRNYGNEIASHSRTHSSLVNIPYVEMQNEVVNSKSDLINMGVTPVNMFVYPYGEYNLDTKATVDSAGYFGARSVDRGFNMRSTDKFALKIQQVDIRTTVDEVKSWIDIAIKDKTWLILMFHQVDASGFEYSTTPEHLQAIVDYLALRTVPVVTMEEGVVQMN